MKIIEGIQNKGLPFHIPNCSRDDLPLFLKEKGFLVGAEIGVYHGEFTEKFLAQGLTMNAIDPWIGYSGAGRTEKIQEKQDTNFEAAKARLATFTNCNMIRKTSMEAVSDFLSESLDFVYIDGDHRFRQFAEDIYEWFIRVKKGGVVAGHDYFCTKPTSTNVICQVSYVVDAFVKTYQIESFYTFGTDRALSWMFFKP